MIAKQKSEKVSFNLPVELKEKALELKKEMNISLNTIYKNAIAEYIKKQEIKKWERGAILASKDKDYLAFCKEWSKVGLEVMDYD